MVWRSGLASETTESHQVLLPTYLS